MSLFVVSAECGDFYCGCGIGHLIGAYSTQELADAAVEYATTIVMVVDGGERTWKRYSDPYITVVKVDELPPQKEDL